MTHTNRTEAGILNLACSVIVTLLHGGEEFEFEHEHVVRAVTRNIAGHIAWSDNFIDSKQNNRNTTRMETNLIDRTFN